MSLSTNISLLIRNTVSSRSNSLFDKVKFKSLAIGKLAGWKYEGKWKL